MRLSLVTIQAVFLFSVFVAAPMESAAEESGASPQPVTVEDILAFRGVGSVRISPDGRWVAYVVTVRDAERNINDSDIWVVRFGGGEPVRLTHHKGQDNNPMWFPDSSWLAFRSDRGEKTQIWGIAPDGGEAWQVSDHETAIGVG